MFFNKQIFSRQWVDNIHKIASSYDLIQGDSIAVAEYSSSLVTEDYKMKIIPIHKHKDVQESLNRVALGANKEKYGFNVWHTIDMVQYTQYDGETKDQYTWHCDSLWYGRPSVQKLTLIVGLTEKDSYEGGVLEFINRKPLQYKLTAGEVVVFPSIVHHRVTPVTKGKRNTLVAWYHGPRWM